MNDTKIKRLCHRGTGGQQGWIYSTEGVMSAIPFSSYKDPPKIVVVKQRRDKVKNENG